MQFNNVWIILYGFMLKGKKLIDHENLFSPNRYDKHGKTVLKYFQWVKRRKNYIALFAVHIKKF